MGNAVNLPEPPGYPQSSCTVAGVYQHLIGLQNWVLKNAEFFNEMARAFGMPSEVCIKKEQPFFYLTETEFNNRSVVHAHEMLIAMQRIRESYDGFIRAYGISSGAVLPERSAIGLEVFSLLVQSSALLQIANLDSEKREAVYHNQVMHIMEYIRSSNDAADVSASFADFEQRRMISYVFNVPALLP